MNVLRWIFVALLLVASIGSPTVSTAASGIKPWQVKNLVVDKASCTAKTYNFTASWTPITWENKPWPNYFVTAHNCASVSAPSCSASRCTVQAASCTVAAPGHWIAVEANIGKSISGVREKVVLPACK